MDRFFRRSMNKKGFTLVELIVVIAIMGVLLAMIIPNLFSSDIPEKGKSYAKSYYFAAQEFFSRQKVAEDPSDSPLGLTLDYYFYTSVDAFGRPVESGVIPVGVTNTMTSAEAMQSNAYASASYKKLILDFEAYMEKNLKECDYEGTYYLVVDNDYRVQAAYWSEATITELRTNSANLRFEDDNIISGFWCCAFPPELSSVAGVTDRAMFKYIY